MSRKNCLVSIYGYKMPRKELINIIKKIHPEPSQEKMRIVIKKTMTILHAINFLLKRYPGEMPKEKEILSRWGFSCFSEEILKEAINIRKTINKELKKFDEIEKKNFGVSIGFTGIDNVISLMFKN